MKIFKLLATSNNKNIIDTLLTLYQQIVKLLLFTIIIPWPDITFVVLQLLQFYKRPEKQQYKVVELVFYYLF